MPSSFARTGCAERTGVNPSDDKGDRDCSRDIGRARFPAMADFLCAISVSSMGLKVEKA